MNSSYEEKSPISYENMIYFFHLIVIVPLIFYITMGKSPASNALSALMMLGVFTLLYHGTKLIMNLAEYYKSRK